MSQAVWHSNWDSVTIVASAAAGTASTNFSMPKGALGCTIFIPQLTASVTLELDSVRPKLNDQDTETIAPLSTVLTGAAAVTKSTVDGFGSSSAATAYSMDAGVLGAGVF